MPELPEVETIKRGLARRIIGLTLTRIEFIDSKLSHKDFRKAEGKKLVDIWRRGKVLGFTLDKAGTSNMVSMIHPDRFGSLVADRYLTFPGSFDGIKEGMLILLFHLKMSGQLIFVPKDHLGKRINGGHPNQEMRGQMPVKSTRAIFTFSDGSHLYFNDQRKFGWIRILSSQNDVSGNGFLSKLGPEPFDHSLNWRGFKSRLLKKPKTTVKSVILDQSVIAGVGNIYACEGLFLAEVDPKRLVGSLSDSEIKKLFLGLRRVLRLGIKMGGSSWTHFVNTAGEKGGYLNSAKVYDREHKPCLVCGEAIKKLKIAGRGTYFCQKCQR